MMVIFDTRYPDNKDGQTYGGIDAHGQTDVSGTYTKTWTLSPAAPVGSAEVVAAAVSNDDSATAHQRLPFRIALVC